MTAPADFFEGALAPVKRLNEVCIEGAEKALETNVAAFRRNSEHVLNAWRASLSVQDFNTARAYWYNQSTAAQAALVDAAADARTLAGIGQVYMQALGQVLGKATTPLR